MLSPPNTATATLDDTRCMMLFIALPDVVSCRASADTPLVMIGIMASPTPTLRTASHSSMYPRVVSGVSCASSYEATAITASPSMTG